MATGTSDLRIGIAGYGIMGRARPGTAVQAICEAMERSAAADRWVKVAEVTG